MKEIKFRFVIKKIEETIIKFLSRFNISMDCQEEAYYVYQYIYRNVI